jgi:hypothetical protein
VGVPYLLSKRRQSLLWSVLAFDNQDLGWFDGLALEPWRHGMKPIVSWTRTPQPATEPTGLLRTSRLRGTLQPNRSAKMSDLEPSQWQLAVAVIAVDVALGRLSWGVYACRYQTERWLTLAASLSLAS